MRTSDIAYVKQPLNNVKPLPPLKDLSLQEISKHYLATCVKSNGSVAACMRCDKKCKYGLRALELVPRVGNVQDEVPYEGSLLQKARMFNEMERQKKAAMNNVETEKNETKPVIVKAPEEKKEKARITWRDWYEDSLKASDQIQYVMDRFGLTRRKAVQKIYITRHDNEGARELDEVYGKKPVEKILEKYKPIDNPEVVKSTNDELKQEKMEVLDNVYLKKTLEHKLENLMNKQESYESEIKFYQEEFERKTKETREKLLKVKEQIDTLCKTMDIFNEN